MSYSATSALEQSQGASSTRIYDCAWSILQKSTRPTQKLLDLGCGNGEFLARLIDQKYTAVHGADGFDFPKAHSEAIAFTRTDLNQKLPYENQSFDVVTALEVIEHLENPRAFIREIVRVLRPQGFLLLSTPNNESITSLISLALRGYYSAFAETCYPAHITPLLRIDVRRILQENKLQQIQFHTTSQGRMPGLPIYWQHVLGPLASGRLFSDNFFVSGRMP